MYICINTAISDPCVCVCVCVCVWGVGGAELLRRLQIDPQRKVSLHACHRESEG